MPMADASRPRIEVWTPRGAGGVAVLALRGPERGRWAARLLCRAGAAPGEAAPFEPSSAQPRLAALVDPDGVVLDEVLVLDRPALGVLELHTHASEAVLQALRGFCAIEDAPVEAGAARWLRAAMGEAQLEVALEQLAFGAEAVAAPAAPAASQAACAAALARRSAVAHALFTPSRLVLCGLQNAGKSTLMNLLLFRERVLAGATPGLTRDPVRETTILAGYPYELVDTAGHGEAVGEVDRRAVAVARREWAAADVLLLVVDAQRGVSPFDRRVLEEAAARVVVVWNKIDAVADPSGLEASPGSPVAGLVVSAIDTASAPAVREELGQLLRLRRGLPVAGPLGGPTPLP